MLVHYPLYGFNKKAVMLERVITLPMTLGTELRHLTLIVDFFLVKVPFIYNVILGRPCMKMARKVVCTYHLMLKFIMEASIGEV